MLSYQEIIELGGFRKDIIFDVLHNDEIYMGDDCCTEYWYDGKPYTRIDCEYYKTVEIRSISAYKNGRPAAKSIDFFEDGTTIRNSFVTII